MPQQDDIIQPVLTDEEIREIQGTHLVTIRSRDALVKSVIVAGRAIESAVLSKLRAPVADERVKLPPLPEPRVIYNGEDDLDEEVYDGDQMKEYARAALASAPVAGEALTRFCPECGLVGDVASGYRSCCPDGGSARMIPVSMAKKCRDNFLLAISRDAAPQASEAVRILFPAHLRKMWSGGEVQAWLDEHQGITAPKPSAKGSLERYRKWQAERDEAFGAGVNAAADLVKKMVEDYDADLGSTDPETGSREYPGEGATWVCEMQELEESIRALSAQPGAQNNGGSDAE